LLGLPLAGCLSTGGLALANLRAAKDLISGAGAGIKQPLKTGFHDPGGKSTI
jgi:hypothetical protein